MTTTRTPGGSTTGTTSDETTRAAAVGDAVADAAGTVKSVAGDAVNRLPEVAATTRSAIEDANRQMRAGSDEMLAVGSALSFGFAIGLLVGGAPRLLIAASLLPAAMMAITRLDRSGGTRGQRAASLQGR